MIVNEYFEMQNILLKQPSVNGNSALIVVAFCYINDKKASRTNGRLECFYAQIFKVKLFNKLLLVRCVPDFLSILEDCTVR